MSEEKHDDQPHFAMMCCAHGAEKAVKSEMADLGWRLAFSRPGFVTAKHDSTDELPEGIFVRTAAHSIGHLKNDLGNQQIESLLGLLSNCPDAKRPFDQLHVWPRDRVAIGKFGFEPGVDEVASAVAAEIIPSLQGKFVTCSAPNLVAQPDQRVLDIVMVDPSDWFIGWHVSRDWPTRWPGGVQPINPKYEPVSRAYFKAAEAIEWSGFDIKPGDRAVEVGSAPGGACGRLLELGCKVTGIDPAEMDPRIEGHKNFNHIRARAGDLPRKVYSGAKWLLVDSNVKPLKTLTAVENIVTHQYCTLTGLLITLKIGDYDQLDPIDTWIEIAEGWRAKKIEVRQLARNRKEICMAVTL